MSKTYRVSMRVPEASQDVFTEALGLLEGAVVAGLPDENGLADLDLYLEREPERGEVIAPLAAISLATGLEIPDFEIEPMPDIDWVAESQKGLPSVWAGRFWLFGSHIKTLPPHGSVPLLVEANTAFGTGQHESTFGCLVAMSLIARRLKPRRILDMGAGSGVLSMAAAKLWRKPVLAVEMDVPSCAVARENARLNGVGAYLHVCEGLGYRPPVVGKFAPYDLILANILAEPLMAMAPDLARHLAPGGYAVLAGLLTRQSRAVIARHREAGLYLERPLEFGEWTTLILRRR